MKKILIITTGGTIGSSVSGGVISVQKNRERFEGFLRECLGGSFSFEVRALMDILSENLDKQHWETLANYLLSADLQNYCGVIITHGSDTLSYTSAMMGFCLCALGVPVVLTAADRVPDDPASNAADNIRGAAAVIGAVEHGVYTVYRNPSDKYCSVYLATRIVEADRVRGCFSSFDGAPFAQVIDGGLVLTEGHSLKETDSYPQIIPTGGGLSLKNDVLMIRPYPGMDASCITFGTNTKAVLVISYHSSSACTDGRGSILSLLNECNKRDTGLFLASFPETDTLYETSFSLLRSGAIPLKHISDEAAYTKLLLAVNLPVGDIRSFMEKPVFHEYI